LPAYLLGVLVAEGGGRQMIHSYWADLSAEEVRVFDAFLDLLDGREELSLGEGLPDFFLKAKGT
jgi:hypothetical protein